jgi:hypothetical protein
MLNLSAPQDIYLNGLNTKFRAYVGGFGSGKTFVGCLDLLVFASRNPKTVQGYFGTSYPAIRDIFYPTFTEAAELMGFTVKILESNKEVHIYRGGAYYGTVICRSMDNPSSIVGFKISRALVDEIDVLNKEKATLAWNKIIARMRLVIKGVVNGIGVTTTPEGFRFVYERFKQEPKADYSMVQASTYENEEFLPPDYIQSLTDSYPSGLINAYIRGQFVNMTSGSVYTSYDRVRHNSFESIQPMERLYIGMDFNVNNMAACIYVERGKALHCVEEISGGRDTPYVIDLINDRWKNQGHDIWIYPDASGKNASSKGASLSDINLLSMAGYIIQAKDANPRVKDRIMSVNKSFEDGKLFINSMRCPETAKCVEQQAYDKNGEPDKKSGLDHQTDAFGYPIAFRMPVVKPQIASPRFG